LQLTPLTSSSATNMSSYQVYYTISDDSTPDSYLLDLKYSLTSIPCIQVNQSPKRQFHSPYILSERAEIGCSPYQQQQESFSLDQMDEMSFYMINNLTQVSSLPQFTNLYTPNEVVVLASIFSSNFKNSSSCVAGRQNNFTEFQYNFETFKQYTDNLAKAVSIFGGGLLLVYGVVWIAANNDKVSKSLRKKVIWICTGVNFISSVVCIILCAITTLAVDHYANDSNAIVDIAVNSCYTNNQINQMFSDIKTSVVDDSQSLTSLKTLLVILNCSGMLTMIGLLAVKHFLLRRRKRIPGHYVVPTEKTSSPKSGGVTINTNV